MAFGGSRRDEDMSRSRGVFRSRRRSCWYLNGSARSLAPLYGRIGPGETMRVFPSPRTSATSGLCRGRAEVARSISHPPSGPEVDTTAPAIVDDDRRVGDEAAPGAVRTSGAAAHSLDRKRRRTIDDILAEIPRRHFGTPWRLIDKDQTARWSAKTAGFYDGKASAPPAPAARSMTAIDLIGRLHDARGAEGQAGGLTISRCSRLARG